MLVYLITIASIMVCNPILENTVWSVYSVASNLDGVEAEAALGVGYLINERMEGATIVIGHDTISMKGRNFNTHGKLLEITSEEIIVQEGGNESRIRYELSSDGKKCQFTLADGTKLWTRKVDN